MTRTVQVSLLLLIVTGATPGLAQEDNSGTNPVNFTYDARFIAEVAEFEDGGGSLLTTTFEFRWPLGRNVANIRGKEKGSPFYDMGSKYSMRMSSDGEPRPGELRGGLAGQPSTGRPGSILWILQFSAS